MSVSEPSSQVAGLAAHQIVEHADFRRPFMQQLVNDVRADKAGAADEQYPRTFESHHGRSFGILDLRFSIADFKSQRSEILNLQSQV
jgi:hypothetical protein